MHCGKVKWKQKVTRNLVKEIAKNSDEGFALLDLEPSGINGLN